jgi:predicted O-methyltransferase YrrM
MSQILPEPVAAYLSALNDRSDPVLDDVKRQGREQGLPIVHSDVGRFLHLLALAQGARRILEIGTAIGYSGIFLARALPADGMLITFERESERAAQARANFERAGVGERANVMIGDAMRLVSKVSGPFDLIFQDSDKLIYEPLLDRLLALLRPGGLLVTDNALWNGEVIPGFVEAPVHDAESTRAIAAYNRRLADDERLHTVVVPLGDGVSVAVKR